MPSTLKELNHAIQKCNAKMLSMVLGSPHGPPQNEEVERLQHRKHCQLTQMIEAKTAELAQMEKKQNTSMQRERQREIAMFRDYCESELQAIEWERSQQSNQSNENNESYQSNGNHKNHKNNENKCNGHKKNGLRHQTAPPKKEERGHFVRSRGPEPRCSLDADAIAMDLTYLMEMAKEQHIDIPDDFVPQSLRNGHRPKQRRNKSMRIRQRPPTVLTSEEDLLSIEAICNKLGIAIEDRALRVRLYGFSNHLDVYREILEWITCFDQKQQTQTVNALTSGKLRDIQVKLRSKGQVGKNSEMKKGIQQSLRTLTAKFKRNDTD